MAEVREMSDIQDKISETMIALYIKAKRRRYEVVGRGVPYAHYGLKGGMDLILRSRENRENAHWRVCTFKPHLRDVRRAIRQVRKARDYFGDLFAGQHSGIDCPLVLMATLDNLLRCMQFHRLLADVEVEFIGSDAEQVKKVRCKYETFMENERRDSDVGSTHARLAALPMPAPVDPALRRRE